MERRNNKGSETMTKKDFVNFIENMDTDDVFDIAAKLVKEGDACTKTVIRDALICEYAKRSFLTFDEAKSAISFF
jgi:hypothetical protein